MWVSPVSQAPGTPRGITTALTCQCPTQSLLSGHLTFPQIHSPHYPRQVREALVSCQDLLNWEFLGLEKESKRDN
jgi:hypothetical protein